MYLLAQYFVHHAGGKPDFDLDGLRKVYENLQTLNSAMADRLREAIRQDAAVNALVILDFFALRFSIEIEDNLQEIRHLFFSLLAKKCIRLPARLPARLEIETANQSRSPFCSRLRADRFFSKIH